MSELDWRTVLDAGQLADDGFKPVSAGEHKIIVMRVDGHVVAYQDACPHEGWPLSKHGERQDFVLVCNKHLWEFDSATGEHISRLPRAECNLKRYPVRQDGDVIQVGLPVSAAT